jgi:superfamily II DNA or RNA helicase
VSPTGTADSQDDSDDDWEDESEDNPNDEDEFFEHEEDEEFDVPDFGQEEYLKKESKEVARMHKRVGYTRVDDEDFISKKREQRREQRDRIADLQEKIHFWSTSKIADVIRTWETHPRTAFQPYGLNPVSALTIYKYMRMILNARKHLNQERPDATEEELRLKERLDEKYTEVMRERKKRLLSSVRKSAEQLPQIQKSVVQAQTENAREPTPLCSEIVLKRYQCGPAYHMLRHPEQRGIACFFKPGYGKTLTAVALATLLFKRGIIQRIVAITPKSLRVNIRTEFQKCGSHAALEVLKKMKVYTYESIDGKTENLAVDKNTLLICDEAHRLRESNTNVYKAVSALARKCGKILAITATPFVNKTNDIVNLLHIIDPERVPVKNYENSPVTTKQLQTYARDLVAFPDEDISNLFARRRDFLVDCPLDDLQLIELLKYDKKIGLSRKPRKGNKQGDPPKKNAYLVHTRQLSLGIYHTKDQDVVASTKVLKLFKNLEKRENLPALVFTSFLSKGIDYVMDVAKRLFSKKAGIAQLRIGVITGRNKESERDTTVQNLNKGELDVVLISDAGSEGLNFRGVRSVHLLNMEWNPAVTEQQVGRALRINAHQHLQPAEQVVNIYKYLSSIPDTLTSFRGNPIHKDSTVFTEQRLYELQLKKSKEQQEAMEALAEVAIQHDCQVPDSHTPPTKPSPQNNDKKLTTKVKMCPAEHFEIGTIFKNGPRKRDYVVRMHNPTNQKVWEVYDAR